MLTRLPPLEPPVVQVVLFDSCDDLNCNPTCQSGLLPGTRRETESVMVWGVVVIVCAVMVLILAAGERDCRTQTRT